MADPPYGAVIAERFRRPRFRGSLQNPDAAAEEFNPLCGDRIRIELMFNEGVVTTMRYRGDACAICLASADVLAGQVEGHSVTNARKITVDELRALLAAEIAPARQACMTLPLTALHRALATTARDPE